MFYEIGFPKTIVQTSISLISFNEVVGLYLACNFIKKETQVLCFPVNFNKVLRISFRKTLPGDCFLKFYYCQKPATLLKKRL